MYLTRVFAGSCLLLMRKMRRFHAGPHRGGRTLSRMVLNRAKTEHTEQESSSEPSLPVFVDASGRRARNLRRTGYGLAACAATYMVVLGMSLMGATPFAPGAILPGDIAAPAAPEPRSPERTPLTPPDGPSVAAGPSDLIVPQLTTPGPPLVPPLLRNPPSSAPAPPDTPGPQAPTTQAPLSPEQPTATDAPPAPAPGTGSTPASPPPAPPAPEPPAPAPPPAPQPTGPATSPAAPPGAVAEPPPPDPSVAEVP